MIDLQADLDSVFYAPDADFAVEIVLRRSGEPDRVFRGLITAADVEQLDRRFISCTHLLRYPSAVVQLVEGDEIEHAGVTYRLPQSPRRVADGHESEAPLTSVQI